MNIPPKIVELCSGLLACAGTTISTWWADVSPIIAAIGVVSGTFVALHGAYHIVKEWLEERKRNKINNNHKDWY